MRKRRSSRTLRSLGEMVRNALPEGAEEKLFFHRVLEAWELVVGPLLAEKSLPVELHEGLLLVKAESPSAAKALSMRGGTIAKALSDRTGMTVRSMRTVVGRASPPARRTIRRAPMKVIPPSERVEEELKRVQGRFPPGQEETARSLASLMALYRTRFPHR